MDSRFSLKATAIAFFIVALSSTAFSATGFSTCQTINQSGVYNLQGNITFDGKDACLEINVSDVTLNGQGHTISVAEDNSVDTSLEIFNASEKRYVDTEDPGEKYLENITVRNLSLEEGDDGVLVKQVRNLTVENFRAQDLSDEAITIDYAENLTLDNVHVENSSGIGLSVGDSSSVNLTDSSFNYNGGYGVSLWNVTVDKFSNISVKINSPLEDIYFDSSVGPVEATSVNLGKGRVVNFTSKGGFRVGGADASAPDGMKILNSIYIEADSEDYVNISYTDEETAGLPEDSIVVGKTSGGRDISSGVDKQDYTVYNSSNTVELNWIYDRVGVMADTDKPHAGFYYFTEYLPGNPQVSVVGKYVQFECDDHTESSPYWLSDPSWDYNQGLTQCKWKFENGSTKSYDPNGSRQYVQKKFTSPGLKTVNMTVRDEENNTDTVSKRFRVISGNGTVREMPASIEFKESLPTQNALLLSGIKNYDGFIAKFNSSGSLWNLTLSDSTRKVVGLEKAENGYIFAGESNHDVMIGKINSSGNVVWNKTLGVNFDEKFGMVKTGDTYTFRVTPSSTEVWKFNETGHILWREDYSGFNNGYLDDMVLLEGSGQSGKVKAVAVRKESYPTKTYWELLRVNSSGFQILKTFKTFSAPSQVADAKKTSSGYVVAGSYNGSKGYGLKLRENLTVEWGRKYSAVSGFEDVASSGSQVLFGGNTGENEWKTVLTNESGEVVEEKLYPGAYSLNTLSFWEERFIHTGSNHLVATVAETESVQAENGCDYSVYSNSTAYDSIRSAVDAASDGDKVCVYEGVYDEQLDISKNITLKGFNANITSGDNDYAIDVREGNATIKGFNFVSNGFESSIRIGKTASPVLDNITVYFGQEGEWSIHARESRGDWVLKDSRLVGGNYAALIADNSSGSFLIHNVTVTGVEGEVNNKNETVGGHGLIVEKSGGNWTISDTRITDVYGDGIDAYKSSNGSIINVTITDTGKNGVNLYQNSGDWRIVNSTIKNITDGTRYAAVNAGNSTGEWKVLNSILTDGEGDAIDAWKAEVKGNASYNYWGTPEGPSGDYNGTGGNAHGEMYVKPYFTDSKLNDTSKNIKMLDQIQVYSLNISRNSTGALISNLSVNESLESLQVDYSINRTENSTLDLGNYSRTDSTQRVIYEWSKQNPEQGNHSVTVLSVNREDRTLESDLRDYVYINGSDSGGSNDSNTSAVNISDFNASYLDGNLNLEIMANQSADTAKISLEDNYTTETPDDVAEFNLTAEDFNSPEQGVYSANVSLEEYSLSGNYSVEMRSYNGVDVSEVEDEVNISKNPDVVANFTYQNSNLYTGDEIKFNASASQASEGKISSYEWDIRNQSLKGKTLSYVFNESGTYSVSLTISTSKEEDSISRNITISPVSRFSITEFDSPEQINKGEETRFNITVENYGTGDGTAIAQFKVNGSNSNSKDGLIKAGGQKTFSFNHIFNQTGVREVSIYIKRGSSAPQDEVSTTVNVTEGSDQPEDPVVNISDFKADYSNGRLIAGVWANKSAESAKISIETSDGTDPEDVANFDLTANDFTQNTVKNETVYVANISLSSYNLSGTYSVKLMSYSGKDIGGDLESVINISEGGDSDSGSGSGGGVSTVIDDFYRNTSTGYPVEAAFTGSLLNVTASSGPYTLINSSGSVLKQSTGSGNFDSSGLSGGRYFLNNSQGNVSSIDIFETGSDVVSRVANFTSPSITVYSYMEGEPINSNRVNVSSSRSWFGDTDVFKINTSDSLEKYWIKVSGQDRQVVKASRSAKRKYNYSDGCGSYDDEEKLETQDEDSDDSTSSGGGCGATLQQVVTEPYVQDFDPETSNVSGTVRNKAFNTTPDNLQVVLIGHQGESFKSKYSAFLPEREPFRTTPYRQTALTDADGTFRFENVPKGSYKIRISNSSWVRTDVDSESVYEYYDALGYSLYRSDIRVGSGNVSARVLATNSTGTINVSVDGPESSYYRYEFSDWTSERYKSYGEVGIGTGQENVTVPQGTYSLSFERYPEGSEDEYRKHLDEINVSQGSVVGVNVSFAETVYLNGTVQPSLEDAYVSIRENGSFNSYYTEVENGSRWDYSKKVAENSTYTVTLYPDRESQYSKKQKVVEVNQNSATLNFTLNPGKYVSGEVTANGEPVKAEIIVSNYTRDFYREGETRAGSYNITGLKNGTYSISVEPESPKYRERTRTLVINGSSVTEENFSVGKSLITLQGDVKVEEGSPEGMELSVSSFRPGVEEREVVLNSSGTYSFQVPSQVFYTVQVDPESEEYREKSKGRFLTSDATVNFTLTKPETFEGVVNTTEGRTVPDAYVYAYNWSTGSYDSDTTGPNGTFELELDNVPHTVEVWPGPESNLPYRKFNLSASEVDQSEGEVKNFTYSTEDITYLAGRVVNADGGLNGSIGVWNESSRSFDYQKLNRTDGSFNLTGLKDVGHNVWIQTRDESIPINRTDITAPGNLGHRKVFNLSQESSSTRELVVTVRDGRPLANVTVSTDSAEKRTNSSGMASFKVATGQSVTLNLNKKGYSSKITDPVNIPSGNGPVTREYSLNRTQEYKVTLNVSEIGSNDTDISPPATVVFVSRENSSSKGGSATVNNEADRPTIEHLTAGNYLVGVATGPDTVYQNKTAAKIPVDGSGTKTLNVSDSNGDAQFKVWYRVSQQ